MGNSVKPGGKCGNHVKPGGNGGKNIKPGGNGGEAGNDGEEHGEADEDRLPGGDVRVLPHLVAVVRVRNKIMRTRKKEGRKQRIMLTMRKMVMTAQVKTTQEFCTSSATVAAFSLPVLILYR